MMKGLVGAIIILIVAFFAIPMIAGGTTDTCRALESHNVSNAATNIAGSNTGVIHDTINAVGQVGATGATTSATASAENPNTPSGVSCTYYYWKSIL